MILVDNFIVTCSEDQSIKVFDLNSLSLVYSSDFASETHTVVVYDFETSARKVKFIFVGDEKGNIYFFNFDSGIILKSCEKRTGL